MPHPNARSDQKAEHEVAKKSKPEGAAFPIEDTMLLKPELNYTRVIAEGHSTAERPVPSYDFGAVPTHLVFSVISIWNFLGVYRYLCVNSLSDRSVADQSDLANPLPSIHSHSRTTKMPSAHLGRTMTCYPKFLRPL
jgi:hypothetical protein